MAGVRMTSGKTSDVTISLNMRRRKQETGLYIWRFKLGLISAFSVFPYVYFFSFFQITVIIIIIAIYISSFYQCSDKARHITTIGILFLLIFCGDWYFPLHAIKSAYLLSLSFHGW